LFFVGLVSEAELHRLYAESSVYVYPAPEEDFGMGIIEAMACGIPVVAWANAGPTGIISHMQDGYLARPFEIDDFSNGLRVCLVDTPLITRFGRAAERKVKKHFSYRKHVEILDTSIRDYLGRL